MPAAGTSIYVHLPFCAAKCDYCDFFSAAGTAPATRAAVLAALRAELAAAPAAPAATLYVGGGDPGQLTGAETVGLLAALRERFPLAPGGEWTMELRPERAAADRLAALRAGGVNRLSLGVQSFRAAERAALGRAGDGGDAALAAALARVRERFDHWNLDLIYGIPGQTLVGWRESLDRAVAAGPPHLAAYALTVAPGTPLARRAAAGELVVPPEESVNEQMALAREMLAAAGYRQYELANWARPGAECRHNLNYWQGGDYRGFGPGAVSTVAGERWRRTEDLDRYVATGGTAVDERETLDDATRLREAVMLGLRLTAGLDLAALAAGHGWDPRSAAAPALARWQGSGHLELAAGRLRLTPAGQCLADQVVADLFP